MFVGIPLLPIALSGRWDWVQGWTYFAICAAGGVGSRVAVFFAHPGLLTERSESLEREGVAAWDRTLAPLMGLGSLAIPLVAGFEARAPRVDFPGWAEGAAVVLLVFGYAFGSWAMVANAFFSGTVRLQEERGHRVVDHGPYQWVRHPGYLGAVVAWLGSPVLLDSAWAFVPTGLLVAVAVVRTRLEDRWLHEHLSGYPEYARRVRARLLPGLW